MDEQFEVVIVGGGPAGATAAAALARAGIRVLVCEREAFPRFHIGESLLPAGNTVFKEIGVWERIEAAGFVRKAGAEFESADGRKWVHNDFSKGLLPGNEYTYQVERARFDALMLEHARDCGATVRQPLGVARIERAASGWNVHLADGTAVRAPYLIDASGREVFLAQQLQISRVPLPYERKIALYGQFRGVQRPAGDRAGNILITRWREGWFWQIPLDDERTSVGLVTTLRAFKAFGGPEAEFLSTTIAATPAVAARFTRASAIDKLRVTADYTYQYERFAGDRFVLAGDAACFIDPVFSSGVYLAMHSGLAAARLVMKALPSARELSPREQAHYTAAFLQRVKVMRGLIDTFYDSRGIEVFLSPSDRWSLPAAVNSVVAGNTHLPWSLRWRYWLFLAIVGLHRRTGRVVAPIS